MYVVDNCSVDGSARAVRIEAPRAEVIEAGANIGFGTAVNIVARLTRGEWLLAANADVALQPGALEELLRAGVETRVACVASRLVLPGGATQHSVHPFPTVPLTLAFNLGLHRLSPQAGDRLCLERFWDPGRSRRVPWAIGACLLLRRTAFEAVGGFAERQWMYAEDLDLQWRLRQNGWSTRYESASRVLHEAAAATSSAFGEDRPARFLGATYAMLRRRRGAARMWATAAINIAGAAARVLVTAPLGVVGNRWRGVSEQNRLWLRAHVKGVRFLDSRLPA